MLSKKEQKKLKQQQKLKLQEKMQQAQQKKQQQEQQKKQKSQDSKQQMPLASKNDKNPLQEVPEQQILEDGDIDFNQIQEVEDEQQIDVTFLVAEIREQYYHSMKTVLLRYGQIVGETEAEVASEVLEKGNLGNVVVAEDDEDQEEEEQQDDQNQQQVNDELNVYSVVTILPSQNKITKKVVKQAIASLEKNQQAVAKSFTKAQQVLKTPKACSLLLSARLPNLPSFIVSDSHEVFVSDLQQLKKKTPKHEIFQSEYVLNVSEVQITNSSTKSLDDLIFAKFEDYEFCQKSLCWWVGENVKSQRQKADLRKLYFIMKLKDYFEATKNIKNYLE